MLFAASSSIWAWVLGRAIAFGPRREICCWWPRFQSQHWYRLTSIHFKMPTPLLLLLPLLLSVSQLPLLLPSNLPTQVLSALSLVSWHAFLPVFIIHIHQEWQIWSWCVVNCILALTALVRKPVCVPCAIVPALLFSWLTVIQSQLVRTTIIRWEQLPVSARQPRLV